MSTTELEVIVRKANRMIDGMTFSTCEVTRNWLRLAMKRIKALTHSYREICELILLKFNIKHESYTGIEL